MQPVMSRKSDVSVMLPRYAAERMGEGMDVSMRSGFVRILPALPSCFVKTRH